MTWPAAGAGLSIKALGQAAFEALVPEQRARGLSPLSSSVPAAPALRPAHRRAFP